MLKIALFLIVPLCCAAQNIKLLNDFEKEFMARKYIKIQADIDELKSTHRSFQQYWKEYNRYDDFNMRFDVLKDQGNNCFEFDSSGIYTTDITLWKLDINNLASSGFDLYEGFLITHTGYFIAVDDSGWVFPLSNNFWIDEFQNFIKKKIGKIDSQEKAMDVVRIYAATKVYREGGGVILEGDCLDSSKTLYKKFLVDGVCPPVITRDQTGNYNIETFILFPGYEELDHYKFSISPDGEIGKKEETIFYESGAVIE